MRNLFLLAAVICFGMAIIKFFAARSTPNVPAPRRASQKYLTLTAEEAKARLDEDDSVILLDVRTQAEWERGHIEGFTHIPLDELRDRLGELPPDAPVYVTCQSGLRSYLACRILAQHGFDAYNFRGGYGFYRVVAADGAPARSTFPCGAER